MIKRSDYPDFRLCVELTNLWLTNTSCRVHESEWVFQENDDDVPNPLYSCPTVMEMLELIPNEVNFISGDTEYKWPYHLRILKSHKIWTGKYDVEFVSKNNKTICSIKYTTLPNWLAELLSWGIQTKYIQLDN